MRKFARAGNKVIFVNSISMGLPSLGHKDLLPRIRRKLGSYSKLARQTDEGITVVSPASLPFFGSAEERQTRGRHDRNAFTCLASELRVTAELALDTRQQILVAQRRQAHRDRVDEDDFVSGAREQAHEVGFRVRVVIPPVFTAKADY